MEEVYVLIDTSERDFIALSFFDIDNMKRVSVEASNRELLRVVDDALTQEHIEKEAIAGIMVVVGEGSFTSTRLAVTVANTFAYVRRIPVLAISKEQAADPQVLISELLKQPAGQYMSATYSAPPSIGGTK